MAGQYDSLGFNVPRKPDPPANAIDAAKGTFHEKTAGYDPLANELYYGNAPGQAEADLQRARGKAEAAAGRQAYQTNLQGFGQSRDQTMQALALQRDAAMGNAPSKAEIAGRAAMDRSLQQQVAAAGATRGGPSATAASYRNAAMNAGAQRAQMTQGIAAERAGEMATARSQYGQTALGSQGQDLSAAGLQQQAELQQRQLNQQGEQFYETQGQRARETELEANLRRKEAADRRGQEGRRLRAAESADEYNRSKDIISTGLGAVGGVIGGIFSDERAKMPAIGGGLGMLGGSGPAAASFDQISPGGGMNVLGSLKAHGDFGTQFVGRPGAQPMLSDMSGKTFLSDVTGKMQAPAFSDERAKMPLPLYEPEGQQLRIGEDGKGYLASEQSERQGASLSGPTPKYGKGEPSKAKESKSESKSKPKAEKRDLAKDADAELAKARKEHDARMAQGPAVRRVASGTPESGYTTELTEGGEKAYREWHDRTAPWDTGKDYDLRGAFADGTDRDGRGHLPDTYKKPNHETFSDESTYAQYEPESAGSWEGETYREKGPPTWLRREVLGSRDPMADANRAMEASPYAYKPEFTPPEQQAGETNVGPMAQTMASDPVAGTAVRRDPQSGMLTIDRDKGLKVVMGGLASLQKQLDAMQAESSTPKRRK